MPNLCELQEALFAGIRAQARPTPGALDPALLVTIAVRPPLGAVERIDIYAQMYVSRLADALAETFPKCAEILGHERFQTLARAYVAESPSTHPSLRQAGRDFGAFLAHAEDVPAYVPDLARLEWARLDVFDAPDGAVLALECLRARSPDAWHALPLRPIDALTTLRSAWPVHEIWAAERAPAAGWTPATTTLRVWRREFLVYQGRMDALERAALALIAPGATFGALCALCEDTPGVEDAARDAAALVLRWIDDGILAASA
jgi:hypothetical protein